MCVCSEFLWTDCVAHYNPHSHRLINWIENSSQLKLDGTLWFMIYLHFEHCTVQLTVYMLHIYIYTHISNIFGWGRHCAPVESRPARQRFSDLFGSQWVLQIHFGREFMRCFPSSYDNFERETMMLNQWNPMSLVFLSIFSRSPMTSYM